MSKPEFKNGANITAGHLRISLQIIGGMIGVVIALIAFIYIDYTTRQDQRDQQQDVMINKLYDELIDITKENTITIDAFKKYVLLRDGIDIDGVIDQHLWPELHEQFSEKKNTRGINFDSIVINRKKTRL